MLVASVKSTSPEISKFIIAKGAVGSLDILEAAKESGISKVEYIGRKPPKAWKGSRAEKIINLNYLQKKSEVHFTGNAREASKLYPKNANVAATIALMGIGFEKTKVKLIADDKPPLYLSVKNKSSLFTGCLLYTSDAADE